MSTILFFKFCSNRINDERTNERSGRGTLIFLLSRIKSKNQTTIKYKDNKEAKAKEMEKINSRSNPLDWKLVGRSYV